MAICINLRCGVEFSPRRKDQRACTIACRDAARRSNPEVRAALSEAQRIYRSNPTVRIAQNANDRARRQTAIYGQPTPDPIMQTKDRYRHARALGYRSGLEVTVANSLAARGVDFDYEQHTLPYNVPARKARCTPDFVLENGIVVETKGLWDSDDRKKVALIREQYPDLDFRMVFNNPNAKISKASKTSYADICLKLGIPFATKDIPSAWLKEPRNEKSIAILESISK